MKEEAKKNKIENEKEIEKEKEKIKVNLDLQTYDENDPEINILKNKKNSLCNVDKNDVDYQKNEDIKNRRLNSGNIKSFINNEGDYSIIPKGSQTDTLRIKDITINSQDLLINSQDNFFISKKTCKNSIRNHFPSRPKNSRSKILGINNSIDPINKVSNSLIKLVEKD